MFVCLFVDCLFVVCVGAVGGVIIIIIIIVVVVVVVVVVVGEDNVRVTLNSRKLKNLKTALKAQSVQCLSVGSTGVKRQFKFQNQVNHRIKTFPPTQTWRSE